MMGFDKMPFTCANTPGKANLKVKRLLYLLGFTNYAYTMTELEQSLLRNPQLFIFFFAVSCVPLFTAAAFRNQRMGRLSAFRYESDPLPGPEPLKLNLRPF
jgi:hypothetical protein